MLVHIVLFNFAPGMTEEQKATFAADARGLARVDTVRQLYVGSPADTERRPAVARDYDCALTVVFDDVAGHDAYQSHPIHLEFVERNKRYFARVRVFDAE